GFDRTLAGFFKCGSRTDVGNAATPGAIDKSRGYVNSTAGNHAVVRLNIGGGKSYLRAAFGPAHDGVFYTVRPAQHATGEIHAAGEQQLADAAGANAPATHSHLRNFISNKAEVPAHPTQQIDVSFAIVSRHLGFVADEVPEVRMR